MTYLSAKFAVWQYSWKDSSLRFAHDYTRDSSLRSEWQCGEQSNATPAQNDNKVSCWGLQKDLERLLPREKLRVAVMRGIRWICPSSVLTLRLIHLPPRGKVYAQRTAEGGSNYKRRVVSSWASAKDLKKILHCVRNDNAACKALLRPIILHSKKRRIKTRLFLLVHRKEFQAPATVPKVDFDMKSCYN